VIPADFNHSGYSETALTRALHPLSVIWAADGVLAWCRLSAVCLLGLALTTMRTARDPGRLPAFHAMLDHSRPTFALRVGI
jgi:hypothetical protein